MVFSTLSLPDAENAFLDDNMVFVQSHVVKSPLDHILDLLCTKLSSWSVDRSNPEHVTIGTYFGFESLSQEPR